MSAYVVKSWEVNTNPNANGNYIEIHGRTPGLISWFLALMGIEPTVAVKVSDKTYSFESGSWGGRFYKSIPMGKISSVFYGYAKPWKEALAIFIILSSVLYGFFIPFANSVFGAGVISIFVSLIVALLYYFLNKKLTLGVFEVGGGAIGIQIKRSVIEGKKLDETDAEHVGDLIKQLLEFKNQ